MVDSSNSKPDRYARLYRLVFLLSNPMVELNDEFGVSDIKDALMPLADTQVSDEDSLIYLDGNKNEVARLTVQDDRGTYVSVDMDKTGEYTQELQDLVENFEGVGMRNGQVQVYEPPKAV